MARQSAPGVPVLVTRPQAEGEAFAAALSARFGDRVRPVVAPLLAPRCLTPDLPDRDYAAVVFTSAQAVEATRHLQPRLPALAWCVGRKTAQVATAAGFQTRAANGDADSLVAALADDPPSGRILYLRGVDTAANILERLRDFGLTADEIVAYIQDPLPLSAQALTLLRSPAPLVVPLMSPRTARLFRDALPADASAPLHIAAISANAAKALGDLPRAALAVAPHPDLPGVLEAVETLLVGLAPP